MRLSDFNHHFYECVIDGEFDTLGNFISSPDCPYLSFAEDEAYLKRACAKPDISCIICPQELAEHPVLLSSGKGVAVSPHPRSAFNRFHNWLADNDPTYVGTLFDTIIGEDCTIHESAIIPPKGVVIGNHVVIQEHVIIRPGTTIGDNVTIGAGAIIGDGSLICVRGTDGNQFEVKQVGGVQIEDHVYIGAYSFIARGSFPYDRTEIGAHTKCDSLIIVSHNSKVGSNCVITSHSHICGNCKIGNHVHISPRAIISNRITVADGAFVDIGSVVVNNIKENGHVGGNFAIDHDKFLAWHRKKLRGK